MMAVSSFATLYKNVNMVKPRDYWDYEAMDIDWNTSDNYQLVRTMSRGRYSDVFEAKCSTTEMPCVIKILKPIDRKLIKREIKVLQNLHGGANIIRLDAIMIDPSTDTVSLAFEYINNTHYRELYEIFTDFDVRFYMFELLKALNYCHSMGIMHRDVKPQNIMIDHKYRTLRLIDWSVAEFYHPGQKYDCRVGSRFVRAPELLVDYQVYNYSADIWSFGCILASLIFKKEPFFQSTNNYEHLAEICLILGTRRLYAYLHKYRIKLDLKFSQFIGNGVHVEWEDFINNQNQDLASLEALDLVKRLLCYDHSKRLTALEAMDHHYFKNISRRV